MTYEDVFPRVRRCIHEVLCDEGYPVQGGMLLTSLGFDSLDSIDLCHRLEQEFGLPEINLKDLSGVQSVHQLTNYIVESANRVPKEVEREQADPAVPVPPGDLPPLPVPGHAP